MITLKFSYINHKWRQTNILWFFFSHSFPSLPLPSSPLLLHIFNSSSSLKVKKTQSFFHGQKLLLHRTYSWPHFWFISRPEWKVADSPQFVSHKDLILCVANQMAHRPMVKIWSCMKTLSLHYSTHAVAMAMPRILWKGQEKRTMFFVISITFYTISPQASWMPFHRARQTSSFSCKHTSYSCPTLKMLSSSTLSLLFSPSSSLLFSP